MSDDARAAAERLITPTAHYGTIEEDVRLVLDIKMVATYALEAADRQAALAAETERLREIVKEAWRFWADITAGHPLPLDRGYSVIRVHPARLAAFDALFRVGAAPDTAPAVAPCAAELGRSREALKMVYGLAAEIQRQTAFAEIGFKCSLIREAVSRSLPDDEAKRLYDQTEAALDAAPAVAPDAEAEVAETCPDCGHLNHAGRRCLAGCSIWHCSAGRRAVAPGASDAGEGEGE